MGVTNFLKCLKSNIHPLEPGIAIVILASTQLPIAVKTIAEIYCMEQVGQAQGSAVAAVIQCNGGGLR